MEKLKNILAQESAGVPVIRLYPGGMFCKAFEYSAYRFCYYIHPYPPRKRYYKVVRREVVSIGFPTSMLEKFHMPEGSHLTEKEKGVKEIWLDSLAQSSPEEEQKSFLIWKRKLPLIPHKRRKKEKEIRTTEDGGWLFNNGQWKMDN
ncbi:MAG: hypothetical protein QM305_06045 [Bacteroidota bacterium]|nr:hypothetical protein [Bacteroidota bacterium]